MDSWIHAHKSTQYILSNANPYLHTHAKVLANNNMFHVPHNKKRILWNLFHLNSRIEWHAQVFCTAAPHVTSIYIYIGNGKTLSENANAPL